MKKLLILTISALSAMSLYAQSESFPLLYSQYGINGTAAYIGKAGAIGALGGDIMSAHYNPAGLGLYRSTEITFSMGLDNTYANATYNGLKSKDSYPSFNYGNLGMVFDFNNGKSSSFRHVQLSFGLNRLMNFNSRNKITRNNMNSSYVYDNVEQQMLDAYYNNVDGLLKDDWYQSGVIDFDTSTNTISSVYDNGTFNQIKSIRESGYLNEFSMSISTNYENWLFLGATLGIPFGDYTCKTSFSEERFVGGVSTGYYNYNTEQYLSVSGINLKLGAIARPTQWLRLGLAIHTPTYYNVDDDFYSDVEYTYGRHGGSWPTYTYNMQSPWRFIGSAAFILGTAQSKLQGTISADYEYANYSFMSFSMDDNVQTETSLNNNIEDMFSSSSTIRLGGELRYGTLRARLGYAHLGNPYSSEDYNNGAWNYVTCGLGYKGKTFFFDLGYAYGKNNNAKYYMYDVYDMNTNQWSSDNNPTKTNTSKHLIQATMGIRF